MYDMKALYEARSAEHAIRLLQEHPQAQIIAGGSDVLVQMREGKRAGAELVSIYGLDELRGVRMEEDGTIRIGPLTSFSHIAKDPLIRKYIGVLGEAVDMVGGPQIRNIGTIGGNTCNGVTSADSASTLFAWDAVIELTGPEGVRRIPIRDFYIRAGKVDLRPSEIQTGILIRRESYEGYQGHYIKYAMRNAMDIATLGCSVNVKLSDDKKTFTDIRIAYGVAGPVPMRFFVFMRFERLVNFCFPEDEGRRPCTGGRRSPSSAFFHRFQRHAPSRRTDSFQPDGAHLPDRLLRTGHSSDR